MTSIDETAVPIRPVPDLEGTDPTSERDAREQRVSALLFLALRHLRQTDEPGEGSLVRPPLILGKYSGLLRWWMLGRLGMACHVYGVTPILLQVDAPENGPQCQIVGRFEPSC